MNWGTLFGREPFICTLAAVIVLAWLATYFLHLQAEQTLTNVVMIIIGYFYGSSTGSKRKDDALIPLTPSRGSISTETTTKSEASSENEVKK